MREVGTVAEMVESQEMRMVAQVIELQEEIEVEGRAFSILGWMVGVARE